MMLFSFLATVAFWGLLIYVGVRIFRSWQGGTTRAEDTLARRFAAGEIDEDEYHRQGAEYEERRRPKLPAGARDLVRLRVGTSGHCAVFPLRWVVSLSYRPSTRPC